MTVTQLDPVTALVVIDLQKGVLRLPLAHPVSEVVARAAELTRAFRERDLPVVLVNVTGRAPGRTERRIEFNPPPDWHELAPELEPQAGDYRVTKMNVGAFYGTSLDLVLRRRAVTQIFLAGISTGSGVEATARAAYDRGYSVVAVTDAMTDTDMATHRHSVEKTFPRIGETATTGEVLELMNTAGMVARQRR